MRRNVHELGLGRKEEREAVKRLPEAAERASIWIVNTSKSSV